MSHFCNAHLCLAQLSEKAVTPHITKNKETRITYNSCSHNLAVFLPMVTFSKTNALIFSHHKLYVDLYIYHL